jgi:hypothetical protein
MASVYKWSIKTGSKLDQAQKLIRIYCVLNDVRPSDTGILVCAYIMVYRLDDKIRELMIKSGVLGSLSSLKNEIYALRKLGLLEGKGKTAKISARICPKPEEALTPQTVLFINLDNRS